MAVQVTLFDNPAYTKRTMTTFGERLKQHLLTKGVTAYRLALEFGIPESTLYSIQKGRRPASDDIIRRLASVPELELTEDQLKTWQILGKATPEQLRYLMSELEVIKSSHEQRN